MGKPFRWGVFILAVVGLGCGEQVVGAILRDAGSLLVDSGAVHAQQPTQCQQWQVKYVFVANASDLDTVPPTDIEPGWEPVGPIDFIGATTSTPRRARMTLRRCTR
jgi:hypothetical protein